MRVGQNKNEKPLIANRPFSAVSSFAWNNGLFFAGLRFAKALGATQGALLIAVAFPREEGEADDGEQSRGPDEDQAPETIAHMGPVA